MMGKAKEICNKVARNIPYVMIISYIMDKGTSMCRQITDDQIAALEGNGMMTADFVQSLVRAAREVAKNCDQSDIVRLIKSDWCCAGEVYDPDLDQFVTDTGSNDDNMWFMEVAETSISYLDDNDLLEDYMEDRGIEFDDAKCEYFGITLD